MPKFGVWLTPLKIDIINRPAIKYPFYKERMSNQVDIIVRETKDVFGHT